MKDELAKVRDALHKLDNIDMPQTNEVTVDQQQHISADSDIAKTKASVMKTVAVRKDASGSAAGDRAGHCSEEKMEAAKRKFRQGYQEAEDAKRLRRTQLVQAPKMMQPVRRCTSSMVKKTLAFTHEGILTEKGLCDRGILHVEEIFTDHESQLSHFMGKKLLIWASLHWLDKFVDKNVLF
uniref:Uncharacterized protein n=1 Tax=Aegilops tauschii TaxID=37682 RepID=M8BBF4_AEGTA